MALAQRLEIRQSQALVMTPQLMQAIKLLQLSNLDLVAYVDAELERNPLLDRQAKTKGRRTPDDATASRRDDAARGRSVDGGDRPDSSGARSMQRLDIDLDDVFPDDAAPSRRADLRAAGRIFRMGGSRRRRPR